MVMLMNSKIWKKLIQSRGRSFIFSTSAPVPVAAAALGKTKGTLLKSIPRSIYTRESLSFPIHNNNINNYCNSCLRCGKKGEVA